MTGVVVPVVITGRNPISATAGRIGIVATDPDPAAANPFIMSTNPDRARIGTTPSMFHPWRRWGATDLDADAYLSGSLIGTDP